MHYIALGTLHPGSLTNTQGIYLRWVVLRRALWGVALPIALWRIRPLWRIALRNLANIRWGDRLRHGRLQIHNCQARKRKHAPVDPEIEDTAHTFRCRLWALSKRQKQNCLVVRPHLVGVHGGSHEPRVGITLINLDLSLCLHAGAHAACQNERQSATGKDPKAIPAAH